MHIIAKRVNGDIPYQHSAVGTRVQGPVAYLVLREGDSLPMRYLGHPRTKSQCTLYGGYPDLYYCQVVRWWCDVLSHQG